VSPPTQGRIGLPGRLARLLLLACVLAVTAGGALVVLRGLHLPDPKTLFGEAAQAKVRVLAADGTLLAERGGTGRPFVPLEQISPWLIKAVIATEDRRFFMHPGVDPVGVARALWANLRAGDTVEGASTISQQLAKNLYLSSERTLRRKLEEALLAFWLEVRLSKEEILTLYLNRVYLGAGTYGVEAAAQRYFAKSARDLTLAESALIAGLLKAPSRYAPTSDLQLARSRATTVLSLMAEQHLIDEDALIAARARPAKLAPERVQLAGWFVDWVLESLDQELGKPRRDRVVRTTLDPTLQRAAEAAVARLLPDGLRPEAAIVVLDTTGAVRAMVGGRDYRAGPFNRAVAARRQPGSAFKPLVYLAALEQGRRPTSTVLDGPVRVRGWQPTNHDGRYHGQVSLTQALALSMNSAAVRLGQELGTARIVATARRLGVTSPLPEVASLPLGTGEVGLLELTAAYLPFASGGVRRRVWAVVSAEESGAGVLYRHQASEARVIDADVARQMDLMLRAVVTEGTGRAAALPDRRVAGKTGTSQDSRDAWFVGYAGELITGVWVGNDDGTPMHGISGGNLPARLWSEVMRTTPAPPAPVAVAEAATRQENGLELILDWVRRTFGTGER
jgi:penicillin-binding protein 1A